MTDTTKDHRNDEPINLVFVVNDVATEQEDYTTIRLARKGTARGFGVALVGLGDFIYDPKDEICAMATVGSAKGEAKDYDSDADYLAMLQGQEEKTRIVASDQDLIMLRSDPADELEARPWAPSSALLFSQLATKSGAIVVNDPGRLTDAVNKTYFQHFPESVRPRTCITRETAEVERFVDDEGGRAVIKPLQGSGGQGVFIIDENNRQNLNQIIEAVTRDGYAIVQEYLPDAADGDIRMLTLNGKPLKVDGTYATLHRFSQTDDHRSNLSAGGGSKMIEPTADMLRVAELVRPKLVADGMYFCGLDLVGDKLMEINVDTPGGLNYMEDHCGVDFAGAILDDMARKVEVHRAYGDTLDNRRLAMI